MRHIVTILLMAVAITTASAANRGVAKEPLPHGISKKELKIKRGEPIDSMSYTMGANMGLSVSIVHLGEGINVDPSIIRYNLLKVYAHDDADVDAAYEFLTSFNYTRTASYLRAKHERDYMMEAGITENLPEIPEIFDETYTCEAVSAAFGSLMGNTLTTSHFDVDIAWVIRGYDDAMVVRSAEEIDAVMLLDNEAMTAQMREIERIERAAAMAEAERVKSENMRLSNEWLAEIEQQEGVRKSSSGLLYRVESVGNGEYPKYDTSKVTVHYEGVLRTGEVFDSSYQRGETITFPLNHVIKGWTEGMKYINEGGKITLWIPSKLAYGENGAGAVIGPNEALQFTIELFEVEN